VVVEKKRKKRLVLTLKPIHLKLKPGFVLIDDRYKKKKEGYLFVLDDLILKSLVAIVCSYDRRTSNTHTLG